MLRPVKTCRKCRAVAFCQRCLKLPMQALSTRTLELGGIEQCGRLMAPVHNNVACFGARRSAAEPLC